MSHNVSGDGYSPESCHSAKPSTDGQTETTMYDYLRVLLSNGDLLHFRADENKKSSTAFIVPLIRSLEMLVTFFPLALFLLIVMFEV